VNIRILLLTVFCGVLAACQSLQAEGRNQTTYVGDGITVDPQMVWTIAVGLGDRDTIRVRTIDGLGLNELLGNRDTVSVWTIDGLGLDELLFFTGVAPGAPLLRIPGVEQKDMVLYNTTMLPDDVMDMIAGTLGKAGDRQLRTSALRPVPFGTVTGFRFDLAFTTEDGLLMKGMALFAQRGKKLDVILFVAPSEYYYDQYAPTVEKIFSSVRVPDVPAVKPAS
jgi:hypothetical protein